MLAYLMICVAVAAIAAVAGYFLFAEWLLAAALWAQRRAAGLAEKSIEIDGHRIVYLEGGRGEPLLLLHGFGANKDHWLLVAPFLTRHYRVIAPDLPGFGDSSRLPGATYTLSDQLNRIHAFARALGLSRFHLGGNSMGGYLAAHYAARERDSVQSLWLLAPAGVAAAEPSELQQMMARGENPLIVRTAADFDRLSKLCFVRPPYVPGAFRRCFVARAIRESEFNTKLFAELFAEAIPLETSVDGLPIRTLIMWGEADRLLHVSGAAVLARVLPNAVSILMPRTGHVPMIEQPAAAADGFLRFQHGTGQALAPAIPD